MSTDRQLLDRYVSEGARDAFAEIVRRHTDRVYAACLRLLGDPHLAEDAVQATFMVLVRKAPRIRRGSVLADWLFWTARHCAQELRRARRRRAAHEREAAMGRSREPKPTEPDAASGDLRARLDLALAALPASQRQAAVLHYFYGRTQEEIARETGCPRTTVTRRLSSALEKLRRSLSRRGVAISAAALAAALAEEAAVTAPAGLAASVEAVCLGGAAASSLAAGAAHGAVKAMALVKIKIAAAAACAVTVVAGSAAVGVMARPAGRTWYVAAGAAAGGTGTAESPFGDAIAAAARLEAGDTLVFRAGVYKCRKDFLVGLGPVQSGRPGRPITFKAHPGEEVIVDGTGSDWGFTSNGRSHIVIDGFEIRNQSGYGVKISARSEEQGVTGSHVTVRNCRIVDAQKECIFAWETPGVTVENCLTRGSKTSQGVSIQRGCRDAVIRGVTSESNALNGIKVRDLEGMLVENCLLRNNGRGLEVAGAKNCTFRNNVIFGNGWRGPKDSSRYDVVFEAGDKEVADPSCRDNLFERNTVANPVGPERKVSRLVQVNTGCTRTTFRENVLYAKGVLVLGFYGDCLAGHVFERNCLFSTTGSQVFVGPGVGTVTLADFAAKNGLRAVGNIFDDPLFADVAGGKLDLKPGSPAGSRGATLPVGCSLPAGGAAAGL